MFTFNTFRFWFTYISCTIWGCGSIKEGSVVPLPYTMKVIMAIIKICEIVLFMANNILCISRIVITKIA